VYFRRILYVATALLMVACSTKKDVAPTRYAVLRFENLTSDPSLNWMGRAASEVLSREIGAVPSSVIYAANEQFGRKPLQAPGVSTEFSNSLLAGANHIISGYFEKDQQSFTFHLVEEEAQTGRRVRELSASGTILTACASLARQITGELKPYPTKDEGALQNFVDGIEGESAAGHFYEAAVSADPNFPDPYIALSELAVAQRNTETVDRLLLQAKSHHLDASTIAKLQLARASAVNDLPARITALRHVLELDPSNSNVALTLGEIEMSEHLFLEAASAFAQGASPSRSDMFNLKAYAFMFGGNEKGALEAIRQYKTYRPEDPNSLDSEGDIQYFFGHFAEAAKLFLGAAAKEPQFNQGSELWKAARAQLMTGDVDGANKTFARYQTEHTREQDLSVPFRVAYWRFLSGDGSAAVEAMHRIADSSPNVALKTLALTQASIWELHEGQKNEAIADSSATLKAGQNPSLIQASLVLFAAQEAASLSALRASAESSFPGPSGEQLRLLAMGYNLFVAKRYADADPIWKELYEKSSPNDPSARLMYAETLSKSGHEAEAEALRRTSPPALSAVAPSFECFYLKPGLKPGSTVAPAK
jgi:tetratricopeptide (TPR) repeat protein